MIANARHFPVIPVPSPVIPARSDSFRRKRQSRRKAGIQTRRSRAYLRPNKIKGISASRYLDSRLPSRLTAGDSLLLRRGNDEKGNDKSFFGKFNAIYLGEALKKPLTFSNKTFGDNSLAAYLANLHDENKEAYDKALRYEINRLLMAFRSMAVTVGTIASDKEGWIQTASVSIGNVLLRFAYDKAIFFTPSLVNAAEKIYVVHREADQTHYDSFQIAESVDITLFLVKRLDHKLNENRQITIGSLNCSVIVVCRDGIAVKYEIEHSRVYCFDTQMRTQGIPTSATQLDISKCEYVSLSN